MVARKCLGVLYAAVPNQRAEGQKLLTFPAWGEFIELLDRAVRAAGYSDRSKFIRDAIREKIEGLGIEVPMELAAAPSRLGVGGRPTHKSPQHSTEKSGGKFPPHQDEAMVVEDRPKTGHKKTIAGVNSKPVSKAISASGVAKKAAGISPKPAH